LRLRLNSVGGPSLERLLNTRSNWFFIFLFGGCVFWPGPPKTMPPVPKIKSC